MKRRPEAKRELYPLYSRHRFGRPVDLKCSRRDDGLVLLTISSFVRKGLIGHATVCHSW